MASSSEDNLDTSRVPVYRIFKSNIRERVRLFSTLIVENSNPSEGNFLNSDPIELSAVKTEDFSEEGGANSDEEDVKPFRDSDTNGDSKAVETVEIDPDLGINGTNQRKRPKLESNGLEAKSTLFYANPPTTSVIQEEEKQMEITAEGIQNKLIEKITKSTTIKSEPQHQPKPEEKEKSFKIPKPVEKALETKQSLKSKQKINSKTSQRFPCKICGQTFSHNSDSQKHEYTHMNWKELEKTNIYHEKCGICHKIFFNKRDYEIHLNHHNKFKPHQCTKCDRKFTRKEHLANHVLHVHSTVEERKKIQESWKNECDVCSMKFRTPSELAKHKLTHSDVKSFNCSQCDKKYKSKKGLTSRQRFHDGRLFKCRTCEKEFGRLSHLTRHEFIHSNQKNCSCYFCHKPFIRKETLTTHMNTVHLNEKAFNCEYCKNRFVDKSALTKHVKSVHSGIRFSCSKCKMTFSQKVHLNRHIKSVHK